MVEKKAWRLSELQRFLQERGVCVGQSRKAELFDLVQKALDIGLPVDPECCAEDRVEVIGAKLKDGNIELSNPALLSGTTDLNILPEFSIFDICTYLLNQNMNVSAIRDYRRSSLMQDGYVNSLETIQMTDGYFAVKASVKPRTRDRDPVTKAPFYFTWSILTKVDVDTRSCILSAFCTCKGGPAQTQIAWKKEHMRMAVRRLMLLVCTISIILGLYHEKHFLRETQQNGMEIGRGKLMSLAHAASQLRSSITCNNVTHIKTGSPCILPAVGKLRSLSSTGTRKKRWLEIKLRDNASCKRKLPIRNPERSGSLLKKSEATMKLSNLLNSLPEQAFLSSDTVNDTCEDQKFLVCRVQYSTNDTLGAQQMGLHVTANNTTHTLPPQAGDISVIHSDVCSMRDQPLHTGSGAYDVPQIPQTPKRCEVNDTTQRFCMTANRNLPERCCPVSGDVDEIFRNKQVRDFAIVTVVLSVSVLGDGDTRQKLKPFLRAICSATGIIPLVPTAIKGQADTDENDNPLVHGACTHVNSTCGCVRKWVKVETEDTTPLWRRFSTFMPTPPVFYTVYPATSFLPGVGSSGRDAMAHLGCRLASLAALHASCNVSRSRLAQAGFYYDSSKTSRNGSNNHEVVCFSCGVTWSSWEASDNPMVIHRRLRPDCDYIKSQGHNVFPQSTSPSSISSGPSSLSSLSTFSTDSSFSSLSSASSLTSWSSTSTDSSQASSCFGFGSSGHGDLATDCAAIAPAPLPPHGHVTPSNQSSSLVSTTARAESGTSARNTPLAYFEDQDDRAQLCLDSAVYPQFSIISERLATFQGWPLGQYFKPDDLVYDGLYYAGYADCLRCFYCGVGLKSWERNDSVMDEHIRWRPTCGFILAVKGRRFVNMTLQRLRAARPDEDCEPTIHGGSVASNASVRNGASNHASAKSATGPTNASAIATTTPFNTPTAAPITTLNTLKAAPTATTTSPAAQGTVPSSEALQQARVMGFGEELIARATRELHQPGMTTVSGTDLSQANGQQSNRSGDLHTDGAHSLETDPQSQRAQEVMRENERLRSMRKCKICNRGTVGVIFMPCGHLLACTECAGRTRNCTRCGQYIRATANVYLN